jgi:hypothetical protein
MAYTVDTSVLRAKIAAMGPRMRQAASEIAAVIDSEIATLATADMIVGAAKSRGKGLRGMPTNATAYLQIRTGNLQASLRIRGNQYHVHREQWDGWLLRLVVGTNIVSAKGFPYAKVHFAGGGKFRARPHLQNAASEYWIRGFGKKNANTLALALAKIWKDT